VVCWAVPLLETSFGPRGAGFGLEFLWKLVRVTGLPWSVSLISSSVRSVTGAPLPSCAITLNRTDCVGQGTCAMAHTAVRATPARIRCNIGKISFDEIIPPMSSIVYLAR